jgi:hypothetical protein
MTSCGVDLHLMDFPFEDHLRPIRLDITDDLLSYRLTPTDTPIMLRQKILGVSTLPFIILALPFLILEAHPFILLALPFLILARPLLIFQKQSSTIFKDKLLFSVRNCLIDGSAMEGITSIKQRRPRPIVITP